LQWEYQYTQILRIQTKKQIKCIVSKQEFHGVSLMSAVQTGISNPALSTYMFLKIYMDVGDPELYIAGGKTSKSCTLE